MSEYSVEAYILREVAQEKGFLQKAIEIYERILAAEKRLMTEESLDEITADLVVALMPEMISEAIQLYYPPVVDFKLIHEGLRNLLRKQIQDSQKQVSKNAN